MEAEIKVFPEERELRGLALGRARLGRGAKRGQPRGKEAWQGPALLPPGCGAPARARRAA